jgi:hypothetical protein
MWFAILTPVLSQVKLSQQWSQFIHSYNLLKQKTDTGTSILKIYELGIDEDNVPAD